MQLTVPSLSAMVPAMLEASVLPPQKDQGRRSFLVLFCRLIRLPNQTGTWLLLLPTLWALVTAARGLPSGRLVAIFIAGAFLMRSAGVVLNDLADRSFDRHVARTRQRPLATGELTSKQAWLVAVILVALAGCLVALLNTLTLLLSPIAVLLAALYPYAKRVVHIPQAMLGIAFGWGAIMAWAASRNVVEAPAWWLFAATVCWAIAYDTIYAIQDMEDDRRIGVKSSALLFGSSVWIAVGVSLAAMLILLAAAGIVAGIGWAFYGTLVVVSLFCYNQTARLKWTIPPTQAFSMFKQHVWIGSVILLGLLLGFAL